jgi:hypothetical protein
MGLLNETGIWARERPKARTVGGIGLSPVSGSIVLTLQLAQLARSGFRIWNNTAASLQSQNPMVLNVIM